MEKETVFNIGDEVWFIQANKVRHGVIKKIRYIKFLSPSNYYVDESETYCIETDLYSVYNSYLAKHTGDGRIYNQLGLCEMQKGQYAKALDAFQKGLKTEDKTVQQSLQFNEIVAYEHIGEFQKAAVLMETYLKTYPDDDKALREYEFLKTR